MQISSRMAMGRCGAPTTDCLCLVRVDPETLEAHVRIELPSVADPDVSRLKGPNLLAAGLGGIWFLDQVGSIGKIDPETASLSVFETPFPFSSFVLGQEAIFGVGFFGDGRLGRVSLNGDVEVVAPGPALQLVAAHDDLVWTVDDATAQVLAIDAQTLQVIRSFSHVGSPQNLWVRGHEAWYLSGQESQDETRSMILVMGRGSPTDLLHLDVESGSSTNLTTIYSPSYGTLEIDDGFVLGTEDFDETVDEDPLCHLNLVHRNGVVERRFDVVGNVDSIATDGLSMWIAGFRVSRQLVGVSRYTLDGELLGEVDFSSIDLDRWLPVPDPIEWPPLEEWAASVRGAVERGLTEPGVSTSRYGVRSEVPPISEEFDLVRVDLRFDEQGPVIDVIFRWNGEDQDLGWSNSIEQKELVADAPDAYVTVYLEENLLAMGFGVENATRTRRAGIDWLTWPREPGVGHES